MLQNNGKPCLSASNGDLRAVNPQWHNNIFFGSEPRSFLWPKQALNFDQWAGVVRQIEGCRWTDPKLDGGAGFDRHDYRLRRRSPCIGASASAQWVDHDAANRHRPRDKAIDLGAFEYAR